MTDDALLPERARLFHIGPPKTASTALQQRAANRRADLLEHGVRYPGRGLTQRTAVASFVGRPVGWTRGGNAAPSRAAWDRLMREVEEDRTNRILFGHEYAAGADDDAAKAFVEAIGPRTHVAITLRDYASMLPSVWQQNTKAGGVEPFDDWLRDVVARPRPARVGGFFVRHDHGALVERWVRAAGADRVTVVVLDRARHDFVYSSFERLLGLPQGFLDAASEGIPGNRGMSAPEAELMRRFNGIVSGRGIGWSDYERLVLSGGALRMLESRRPAADEARLLLPAWAAPVVDEDAARNVERIRATGVRVLGDLDALAAPAAVRSEGQEAPSSMLAVPVDAAAEAMAGLLSAGLEQGWDFGARLSGRYSGPRSPVADVPARDLVRELVARTARRGRRATRRLRARIRPSA